MGLMKCYIKNEKKEEKLNTQKHILLGGQINNLKHTAWPDPDYPNDIFLVQGRYIHLSILQNLF